jgi:O-acetyl-ADP-ribose deacetylase (regulator of RNase III)
MITYVKGDATDPQGDGRKIIAHVCNDSGGWGSGFVLAVSRRWPEPERVYRRSSPELGAVQAVAVEPDTLVVNMVAQHGYATRERPVAVDYEALTACLRKVATFCAAIDASVHMPRIGCGLGGGDWSRVETIVEAELDGLDVRVYDL